MKLLQNDIEKFVAVLKGHLGLPSYTYAQLSFLINKFGQMKDEKAVQKLIDLNLLMALFYYESDSALIFRKYFSAAVAYSEKVQYQFQFIIDSLRPLVFETQKITEPSIFSEGEMKLLNILKSEKLDKFALIERLYGPHLDFFAAENRLKNLIFRIRKKQNNLIVCQDGYFILVDKN